MASPLALSLYLSG